jgi:hypothetical protein
VRSGCGVVVDDAPDAADEADDEGDVFDEDVTSGTVIAAAKRRTAATPPRTRVLG